VYVIRTYMYNKQYKESRVNTYPLRISNANKYQTYTWSKEECFVKENVN